MMHLIRQEWTAPPLQVGDPSCTEAALKVRHAACFAMRMWRLPPPDSECRRAWSASGGPRDAQREGGVDGRTHSVVHAAARPKDALAFAGALPPQRRGGGHARGGRERRLGDAAAVHAAAGAAAGGAHGTAHAAAGGAGARLAQPPAGPVHRLRAKPPPKPLSMHERGSVCVCVCVCERVELRVRQLVAAQSTQLAPR
jgi:hypothetical protein